jgi:hypothetical protein
MADDLMEKADALMRRRRVFVAGAPEQKSLLAEDDGDDVPVLTEIVDPAARPAAPGPRGRPDDLRFDRLANQRQALAEELAAWLDTELPRVIMAALDGVTDQIVAEVTAEARAALLPRLQAALEAEERDAPTPK